MSDQQFAAFFAPLAVIGLSSVGLLFVHACDIWQYASSSETQQ
jgi:hypothetical protein